MKEQEKLAVVICDHDKGPAVNECIGSVLASEGIDVRSAIKIFVIDNASDDGSGAVICGRYRDSITYIRTDTDLGSSGGLNLGLKKALDEGFRYICCLGEEITVAPDTLAILLSYMTADPGVGLAGGKVYHRHLPHYIQQFGISVDFKHFRASTLYADTQDSSIMPNIVYCDAIASCAMIVSAEAIKRVGFLPEENFLYWDDTEWGYKIKQSGLEVVALGAAKFYHSADPMHRCDNTKVNYYMTRNCLRFFMRYTDPQRCTQMSIVLLRSIFEAFYLHRMGHAHNMAQSDIAALLDAIYGVRGRAPDDRILCNDDSGLGFVGFFEEQDAVYMEEDDPFLEQVIRQINPHITFMQLPDPGAVTIIRCASILEVKDFDFSLDYSENVVYIDKNYRMLASREDIRQMQDYQSNLQTFLYAMQPVLLRRISEMRGLEF